MGSLPPWLFLRPGRLTTPATPVEFPEPPIEAAAQAGVELLPASDYMTCTFGAQREWFGTDDLRVDHVGAEPFAAVREGAANGQRFLGQDPLPVS